MIGLDTNVLVRYLMQDDAAQAAKASRLIERCSAEEPGFIAMVVLVELVWVLESSYGIERARIAAALELLLRTRELRVEQAETAWHAVRMYRDSRADFADALIALEKQAPEGPWRSSGRLRAHPDLRPRRRPAFRNGAALVSGSALNRGPGANCGHPRTRNAHCLGTDAACDEGRK